MSTKFLELQAGKIAYDDMGSGPLAICVPSMGDLRAEYRFLAPQLTAAGYRVISMDVRGHGETSPLWPDYSVSAIGSDLLALIRGLDAGPALVVGTSMAAGASVWAAAEAPDLIRGLVLVGPFVRGGSSWTSRFIYSVLFANPWGTVMWLKYYSTLYPSRKPADFAEYRAALRANLKQPARLEALRQMLYASKTASEERLARVTAPTKVIMGSKDPDFKDPKAEGQWVADRLHGTVSLIEGAGHYPHAEVPEIAGPLILTFLQELKEKREKTDAA